MFLTVLLALLSPVRPCLIQLTVDKYITNQWVQMLVIVTIIQVVMLLLETLVRFFFIHHQLAGAVRDQRSSRGCVPQVVRLNLPFFDRTPIGTLTTRTINDIEAINDIFSEGIISIVADVLMILRHPGVMFCAKTGGLRSSAFPFPRADTHYRTGSRSAVNKSFHRAYRSGCFERLSAGAHHRYAGGSRRFQRRTGSSANSGMINKDHRKANIDAIFAYSVFFPVVEIILAISLGLMVWWEAPIRC